MTFLLRVLISAAAVTAWQALSGCSEVSDEVRLIHARELLAQKDSAGAVLELKALLQTSPQDGQARRLLGKALLAAGNPAAAEAELTRALELGESVDDVLPDLGLALMAQRKEAQLLSAYGNKRLGQAGPAATFLSLLAEAHAIKGALPVARRLLAEALRLQPDHAAARLLDARLSAAGGDTALAGKQVDALLERHADDADVRMFKAELLQAGGAEASAVLAAYRQVLALQPGALAAHTALMSSMIRLGDFDSARQQWQAMTEVLPQHPQTMFFDALLAQQRGESAQARELAQGLVRRLPDDPMVLLLAGQTELRAGALSQAEAMLAKAVRISPQAPAPRRLLARLHLRAGQPDRALLTLKPLTSTAEPDPQALLLAVRAAQQKGSLVDAERDFRRAEQRPPVDKPIALAISLARFGKDDAVLAEFELPADPETAGAEAAMASISAQMVRKEHDAALKALDALAARQPTSPVPDDLRGRIALQRQNPDQARRHFDQALNLDKDYPPALSALALLDLADQRSERPLASLPPEPARPKPRGAELALLTHPPEAAGPGIARGRELAASAGEAPLAALAGPAASLLPARPELQDALARVPALGPAPDQPIGPAPGSKLAVSARPSQPPAWRKLWSVAKATVKASVELFGLGLLLVPLIAALRPEFFVVKRSVVVNASAQRIFGLLQDLRQWEHWSAWPQFSGTMRRGFNQTTAGRGAYCTWQDKRRDAQGSVEILSLTAPDQLVVDLALNRPDEVHHVFEFTLSPDSAGGTVVHCVARGPASFWLRLRSVLYPIDWRIGKPLRLNLARLKAAAEAAPAASPDPTQQGAAAAA